MSIAVHRFEELIGGHPYLIEVAAVANDRWRACIVRIGGPIALMPFYGPTPDEAARRLCQWLARAHEPASVECANEIIRPHARALVYNVRVRTAKKGSTGSGRGKKDAL
jgi:hypothetical protein